MKKLKILQVFSRYLEYGGEELIAGRLEDALAEQHEMYRYVGSTEKLIEGGPFNKALIPFRTRYNTIVEKDLRKEQASNQHDLWIVHNIFPALSPSVYAVAKELHVPIVHYLHNYRMSCANGYFLNHGKPCERCAQGNFWPALKTGCWRDSRATSGWMGTILQDMRKNDIFHQVRRWVTPSESQKNIHIRMGLPASRIDVVPYFIEAQETFSPVPENGNVLFLGRLSQEKGVENLLRAWALCSSGKRKLVIAGTGKEEKALRALAKVLKLENVNFVGFVTREEQPELWAKTSFSVIPSIWNEPFPLSFMEAWKNGRPFVGSRLGAMSEVLQDGGGGLLADPFSPEDLAKQITYLLQHQEESRRLGEVGHRKILSLYNKQKWLDRFNRVLEDAINPIKTIPTQATRLSSTMFHACTLFDTGFLAKGLALFRSLRRQGTPFHLYVFAMDDFTAQYLKSLAEPEITVIPIIEFEGPELLRIKPTRSRAEYYWTCGSSSVAYVLKNFSVESCTYLDADVYFYAPPQEIEALIGDASIGITPHQYSAPYDQNRLHGVYCVQYVTFRNDERGLQALRWWCDKCIDWCFALPDAGRFGDQKYLDDWPERFAGVKILDAAGIGLAPWNCRDYQLMKCAEGGFMVKNKGDGETGRLSFFHFHELRFFTKDRIKLVAGGYEVSEEVLQQCYGPYIRELVQIANEIKQKHPSANPLGVQPPDYKKMLMAKIYAAINPRFYDHYISKNRALGL